MATVAVIPRPGKITPEELEAVVMDVVRSEQHDLTNTITDHPVEEGVNFSDHIRVDPDRLTQVCLISNTPLSTGQQSRAVRQGDFTVTTTAEDRGKIGNIDGLALAAYKKLRNLRDKGAIVTVSTTLEDYASMAIAQLSLPRTAKNYDGIEVTISYKKIRVVRNRLTRNTKSTDPRAQEKGKAGAQATKPAEERKQSAAFKGADATSATMQSSSNSTISGAGNFIQGALR